MAQQSLIVCKPRLAIAGAVLFALGQFSAFVGHVSNAAFMIQLGTWLGGERGMRFLSAWGPVVGMFGGFAFLAFALRPLRDEGGNEDSSLVARIEGLLSQPESNLEKLINQPRIIR